MTLAEAASVRCLTWRLEVSFFLASMVAAQSRLEKRCSLEVNSAEGGPRAPESESKLVVDVGDFPDLDEHEEEAFRPSFERPTPASAD